MNHTSRFSIYCKTMLACVRLPNSSHGQAFQVYFPPLLKPPPQ